MTIEQQSAFPPPAAPPAAKPGPVGIGGWLILPILGFVGTIGLTLWNLAQGLSEMKGLAAIFAATSGPLAQLRVPLALSLLAGVLVIASASYCLFLIYRKDAAITRFATAHYLILMASGFIDLWSDAVLQQVAPNTPVDTSTIKEAVRGVVIAAIWIPYFQFSKRVRNTFTNTGAPARMAAE